MGAAEMQAGAEAERICVLGGGFGGLYAALRLQQMPWRGRKPIVTLVDKRDKFTFLPLLYEFASESRELDGWRRRYWRRFSGWELCLPGRFAIAPTVSRLDGSRERGLQRLLSRLVVQSSPRAFHCLQLSKA